MEYMICRNDIAVYWTNKIYYHFQIPMVWLFTYQTAFPVYIYCFTHDSFSFFSSFFFIKHLSNLSIFEMRWYDIQGNKKKTTQEPFTFHMHFNGLSQINATSYIAIQCNKNGINCLADIDDTYIRCKNSYIVFHSKKKK